MIYITVFLILITFNFGFSNDDIDKRNFFTELLNLENNLVTKKIYSNDFDSNNFYSNNFNSNNFYSNNFDSYTSSNQFYSQINSQVNSQVYSQAYSHAYSHLYSQTYSHLYSNSHNSLCLSYNNLQSYKSFYSKKVCTINPIINPSIQPTTLPTTLPTNYPTNYPSNYPINYPTNYPTNYPSTHPSIHPSTQKTNIPTITPSIQKYITLSFDTGIILSGLASSNINASTINLLIETIGWSMNLSTNNIKWIKNEQVQRRLEWIIYTKINPKSNGINIKFVTNIFVTLNGYYFKYSSKPLLLYSQLTTNIQSSVLSGQFLSYLTNITSQSNLTNLLNLNIIGTIFTSPNITYPLNYSQPMSSIPTILPTTKQDYSSEDNYELALLISIPLFIGLIIITYITIEYIKRNNKISNSNSDSSNISLIENTIESNSLNSIVPIDLEPNTK